MSTDLQRCWVRLEVVEAERGMIILLSVWWVRQLVCDGCSWVRVVGGCLVLGVTRIDVCTKGSGKNGFSASLCFVDYGREMSPLAWFDVMRLFVLLGGVEE